MYYTEAISLELTLHFLKTATKSFNFVRMIMQ